jgi:hypothetical protein
MDVEPASISSGTGEKDHRLIVRNHDTDADTMLNSDVE